MKKRIFTGFDAAIFLLQLSDLEIYHDCRGLGRHVQLICQKSDGTAIVHNLKMVWAAAAEFSRDKQNNRRLSCVNFTIETQAKPDFEFEVIVDTSVFTSEDGNFVSRVEIPANEYPTNEQLARLRDPGWRQ